MVMQVMHRSSANAASCASHVSASSSRPLRQVLPLAAQPKLRTPLRWHGDSRSRSTVVAAVDTEPPKTDNENKPDVARFADSIGLPTDEGLFGFKPFSEVWVGRLAMMGFLVSLLEEFWTGKGTLAQIGIATPSLPVLGVFLGLSAGATLWATSQTLVKAQTGNLEPQTVGRYKSFLGIRPDAEINAEADALKRRGDFTDPPTEADFKQIAETKAEGTPADRFLNQSGQEAEANQAAEELKEQEQRAKEYKDKGPSLALDARSDIVEQTSAQAGEWAYARMVEVQNGRAAMIGFWACVAVEAATGRGIIGQVVLYLKALNILGPASGF